MAEQILSEQRLSRMRKAFSAWYDGQEDKKAAMKQLGRYNAGSRWAWINGRGIPSEALYQLYQLTGNKVFCLTRSEKEQYKVRMKSDPRVNLAIFDDIERWPDLEEPQGVPAESLPEGVPKEGPSETPMAAEKPPGKKPRRKPQDQNPEISAVAERIKGCIRDINKFGSLPEDDPAREEARKTLVEPAMELFEELTRLALPFPALFREQLEKITLARTSLKRT